MNVVLYGKMDFVDVTHVGLLSWGHHPGLSGWIRGIIRVLVIIRDTGGRTRKEGNLLVEQKVGRGEAF